MTDIFGKLTGLALRAVLLLAALVFFASLVLAAFLILLGWLLRALWAKLTDQPVKPWTFQINRQAVWQRFYRGTSGQQHKSARPDQEDVIDVEAKRMDAPDR